MAPGQEDFDMAEYEVLEHCSAEELQSQTLWPSPPSPPSASPTVGPAPQEEGEDVGRGVQVGSRSPQLRLIKKKAPEVLPVE